LHDKSVHGAKINPEGNKDTNQRNVWTRVQTSQTTTVNNKGSSWGTPWMSNNRIILKVSNPDNNKSSHSTITKTNDFN